MDNEVTHEKFFGENIKRIINTLKKSKMAKQKLFQYAILWHPNEKQEEEGKKSKLLVEPKIIMAIDANGALMAAAMEIPQDKREELDQIEIAMRPF